MNNDDNLDLLDLDNSESMDNLPEVPAFAAPRPKKPWLLLGIGVVVIILATYVIVSTIGGTSDSAIEVDLDAPVVVVDGGDATAPLVVPDAPVEPVAIAPVPAPVVQPMPVPAPKPAPAPVAKPAPVQATPGVPVRVVEERQAVTFNPDKPAAKPAPVKKAAPAKQPAVAKPAPKPAPKAQTPKTFSWYVQFGSYGTNAAAAAAQRKIAAQHPSLFNGKQFVILAAVLPNGTTTYRLRVGFATAAEANGFCRNAKSDGLDCYVAK